MKALVLITGTTKSSSLSTPWYRQPCSRSPQAEEIEEKYDELLVLFGEKPGTDSEDVFSGIADFLAQFKQTVAKMPVDEEAGAAKKETVVLARAS